LSTYEEDQVITSNWKMTLTMKTELTTHPEATVTIQGLSRFHLNGLGKIYRHSIDGYDIRLNEVMKPEEAELFLVRLANAPQVGGAPVAATVVDVESREEKDEKLRVNIRRAYDSLGNDIPQILQFESKGKKPLDWDIYTEDVQIDFPNPVDSETLGLFSAVAVKHVPSWTSGIKGKALYKAALQELRVFIDNFVDKAEVTGQDWCMDKDSDWCVIMEELSGLDPEPSTHQGDQVITSNWKMVLTMKTESLKTMKTQKTTKMTKKTMKTLTTTPEAVVTIQGLSRFHLNEEGKIYRHSIDGYDVSLNEDMKLEEAGLFLTRLANAPQAMK